MCEIVASIVVKRSLKNKSVRDNHKEGLHCTWIHSSLLFSVCVYDVEATTVVMLCFKNERRFHEQVLQCESVCGSLGWWSKSRKLGDWHLLIDSIDEEDTSINVAGVNESERL